MYKRILQRPEKSFFIFGPRGCGKTVWLTQTFPDAALKISLLETDRYLQFQQQPSLLRKMTASLDANAWVVLDEIQKVPALLDEVHLIYQERGLNFALSGSSARKLKRSGANMLAGRALRVDLFPFSQMEYGSDYSIQEAIEWGTLPPVVMAANLRPDVLEAYVSTYLKEEIAQEALVRSLDPFVRFLRSCGQYHGQLLNVESLARDAGIKRSTVDRYFEILEDTLLATRLPALRPGFKTKESSHDKFYLFDSGVARSCSGFVRVELDQIWRGYSFEGLVHMELQAYNSYSKKKRSIFHYTVNQGYDIDFVIEARPKTFSQPSTYVAVEVKAGMVFKDAWLKSLGDFKKMMGDRLLKSFVVYNGEDSLRADGVDILPFKTFCQKLYEGTVF